MGIYEPIGICYYSTCIDKARETYLLDQGNCFGKRIARVQALVVVVVIVVIAVRGTFTVRGSWRDSLYKMLGGEMKGMFHAPILQVRVEIRQCASTYNMSCSCVTHPACTDEVLWSSRRVVRFTVAPSLVNHPTFPHSPYRSNTRLNISAMFFPVCLPWIS